MIIKGVPKTNVYIDKEGKAKAQIEVNLSEINILTYPKDRENKENVESISSSKIEDIGDDEIPF